MDREASMNLYTLYISFSHMTYSRDYPDVDPAKRPDNASGIHSFLSSFLSSPSRPIGERIDHRYARDFSSESPF